MLVFGFVAVCPRNDAFEKFQFIRGPTDFVGHGVASRRCITCVEGVHHDEQIVADCGGLWLLAGEHADRVVPGCDLVHCDGNGKIDDFVVMVRPLSAANALQVAWEPKWNGLSTKLR